jgi:preprotein translocase subunit SecG
MYNLVLALHIFLCILLIVAVLIQSGKGGDIGSALGGGSASNEGFGPGAPANIMNKITTGIAACFLILSLVLALLANNRTPSSIMQGYSEPPVQGEFQDAPSDIIQGFPELPVQGE